MVLNYKVTFSTIRNSIFTCRHKHLFVMPFISIFEKKEVDGTKFRLISTANN
jgi:hypothetical protein